MAKTHVILGEDGKMQTLSGDQIVSMNTWGFGVGFFELLRERFEAFLAEHVAMPKSEFYLPAGVQELMRAGRARVKVLPTTDRWVGVTHKEDKPRVVEMIAELVKQGKYPKQLWEG